MSRTSTFFSSQGPWVAMDKYISLTRPTVAFNSLIVSVIFLKTLMNTMRKQNSECSLICMGNIFTH